MLGVWFIGSFVECVCMCVYACVYLWVLGREDFMACVFLEFDLFRGDIVSEFFFFGIVWGIVLEFL